MTVRAAVMTAPGAPMEVWDVSAPDMEDGAVLLETIASEVCGTDVHLHHGRLAGVPYPIIPGHVSVGRIHESRGVASDALGVPIAPGDVVTFYDVHEVCGECWHCTVASQPNRCPARRVYGITYAATDGLLGGWAEKIYLKPGVRIIKLDEGTSTDDVIGGGCGLFTGFGAVERSTLAMGDVVVIQGAGPVGLSATAFARLRGAGTIVTIGAPDARLNLATDLGADITLSIETTDEVERRDHIRALTNGRGADVVIEAAGSADAVPEGLHLLRDGGVYVIAGHYTDVGTAEINAHLDINQKHADIRGQWGTAFRHVVRALAMLAKHQLPFAQVIGGRYGLDDTDQALSDVADLAVTKAIVTPNA